MRRLTVAVAFLLCIPAIAACGSTAPSAPAGQAGAAHGSGATPAAGAFTVYDTTHYTNVDLEQYGAVRADLIYEGPVAKLAGQDENNFAGADRSKFELNLPPKDAYQNLVRQHLANPGPLVLDYESLYLKGKPDVAQRRFLKLSTLLEWTREAAPGKTIGFYGVLGNTTPEYYPLAKQLAEHEDAFFPTLYTVSGPDRTAWQQMLDKDIAEAKQVGPGKPVYPFLWPQYHENTPNGLQFLPADLWSYELEQSRKVGKGVVMWSSTVPSTDEGWVTATRNFVASGAK